MIKNCMKQDVVSIPATATIREAGLRMAERHIGLLPVVDGQEKLIGVIGLPELLSLEMPAFFNLITDLDFVSDFGAVETTRPQPEQVDQPVTELMQPASSVDEECGMLRAYGLMLKPVGPAGGLGKRAAGRHRFAGGYWRRDPFGLERNRSILPMIATILSGLILIVTLYLIFSERLNRTIASLAGAVAMVVLGLIAGFYTEEQAGATIDFNTIGLLLGMMILVSILEPTGFFQYLAVLVGKRSGGKPVRLLILLGTITTLMSMFLDNVTTVVLIAPVTILICEILGLSSQPYLMTEAILSDTGGVATLIGDPPNILIGSAAGLSFVDFLTHSLPIVLVVWLVALVMLRYMFRKELAQLPTNLDALAELKPASALKDAKTAKKVLWVIAAAVIFFLLEEALHVRPVLIALGASAIALVWVRPSIEETLKRIQWDVLLFFAALFVLIGGLQASGVMQSLAGLIAQAQDLPPVLLGLFILWIVALLSAVVDNVPITIALIPVIQNLGIAGIPTAPLWWALVFGAGFGGNGTIIGSTANIVVASLSERTHTPITPIVWNKRGLPIMLVTCAVASLLFVLAYPLFI
jgi:Na+/H+ antiporter NhaD/arsenite permease-like protein